MDFRYDKTNPKHRYRISLVSKGFDKKWYLAVALIQLPLIVLIGYLVYGVKESIIYVGLALVSLTLYNLLNKRSGRLAGLTHLLFPLALVLLCMGGYTLFDSITDMNLTFVFLLLSLFFNTLLANGICGGLKDLKSDQLAGAGSLAIFLKSTFSGKTVQISKPTRFIAQALFWMNVLLIVVQGLLNSIPFWIYPIALILIFYGYAHLTAYLKLKKPHALIRFDAYTGSAFLFYATSLAWIQELPLLWWTVIGINLLYPFVVRRDGHFGLSTLTSFFIKPQMDQKL